MTFNRRGPVRLAFWRRSKALAQIVSFWSSRKLNAEELKTDSKIVGYRPRAKD
ncbi:MAG: hypothetical protein LBI10_09070 [Deltaproteobacteria bacterium]|nr:hypothetical protein [Deltaproteobacteria bacterium]